jgi:hypothetical protein
MFERLRLPSAQRFAVYAVMANILGMGAGNHLAGLEEALRNRMSASTCTAKKRRPSCSGPSDSTILGIQETQAAQKQSETQVG